MSLPSEITFWSWAIRGLGGAVNILEDMTEFGPRLTEQQGKELQGLCERLYNVTGKLSARQIDQGAAYHGPDHERFLANEQQPGHVAGIDTAAGDTD